MLFSIKSNILASIAGFAALIHNIGIVNSQEVVNSVIDASAYDSSFSAESADSHFGSIRAAAVEDMDLNANGKDAEEKGEVTLRGAFDYDMYEPGKISIQQINGILGSGTTDTIRVKFIALSSYNDPVIYTRAKVPRPSEDWVDFRFGSLDWPSDYMVNVTTEGRDAWWMDSVQLLMETGQEDTEWSYDYLLEKQWGLPGNSFGLCLSNEVYDMQTRSQQRITWKGKCYYEIAMTKNNGWYGRYRNSNGQDVEEHWW
eukprot:scaffold64434_cov52-Cyclotella_meneghiniana.AAC.3